MNMRGSYGISMEDFSVFKYSKDIELLLKTILHLRNKFSFNNTLFLYFFDSYKEARKSIGVYIPDTCSALSIEDSIVCISSKYWYKQQYGSIDSSIIHEFIHVIINSFSVECPLWIHEGLAQFYSGEYMKFNKIRRSIPKNLDVYSLTYDDELLYYLSSKLMEILIEQYSENDIIERIKNINTFKGFKDDDILGEKSLNKLLLGKKKL